MHRWWEPAVSQVCVGLLFVASSRTGQEGDTRPFNEELGVQPVSASSDIFSQGFENHIIRRAAVQTKLDKQLLYYATGGTLPRDIKHSHRRYKLNNITKSISNPSLVCPCPNLSNKIFCPCPNLSNKILTPTVGRSTSK